MGIITLLIPALIIIGIVAISARSEKAVTRKGKISYSHRVLWIFGGYIAVLLICVVLAAVHPVKTTDGLKKVNYKDVEQESIDLYETAVEGRIDQVDKKFIRKQWEFTLTGQQLDISVENEEYQNTSIIVERKNTNDGKMEAVFYRTRSNVDGIDITELATPPKLVLTEAGLTLKNPKKGKLAFLVFSSPFSVSQFTGEASFSDHDSPITHGQSILYLRIPKDLVLPDQSNLNLQFVE